MAQAAYQISVDGEDVSSAFSPVLISLTITDCDGGKADTLDIELRDDGGQIALPEPGAPIEALLWWAEAPPYATSGAVQFTGTTDEPKSKGGRKEGRTLSISAKSADLKGKGKHKLSQHQDNMSFGAVAQQWGAAAGYQVSIDPSLTSIARSYWVMANESFLGWAARIADELGATFKCAFPKAVFVPRDSTSSASGQALPGVAATVGLNVISWDLSPAQSASVYANSKARWYDSTQAQWNTASVALGGSAAEADYTDAFKASDAPHANARATSNKNKSKRGQGAGTVEIDGDAGAMSQANLTLTGARPGIDGQYIIKTAKHHFTRRGGWVSSCTLELPQGTAGTDSRATTPPSNAPSSGGSPEGNTPLLA